MPIPLAASTHPWLVITGIIVAIAIPNLLASRRAANEYLKQFPSGTYREPIARLAAQK